jgi:hypothetical protein
LRYHARAETIAVRGAFIVGIGIDGNISTCAVAATAFLYG